MLVEIYLDALEVKVSAITTCSSPGCQRRLENRPEKTGHDSNLSNFNVYKRKDNVTSTNRAVIYEDVYRL